MNMKKEDAIKIVKDKRILAGIAALLILVAVILCVAAVRQNAGRRTGGMAAVMMESLENSGFSWLPGEKRELEQAAEAAAEFLDELVSVGAGRQDMVEKLQGYLTGLDWGLTEEQAAELAEWLVDVYLQNYEAVYGEPSGVSQTKVELSDTFLEEMRSDLQNIAEYLTQLDASVTKNKEELISLTELQDGNYEELSGYLEELGNVISTIRSELTKYQSGQTEQQVLSTQQFTDIKAGMDSLSQAILELESRLKENIQSTDGNNGGRYEALEEELDGLSTDLQNKVDALNKRLSDMLAELKMAGNGMNTGLTDLISRTQNEISVLLNRLEQANQIRYEQMEAESNSRNEQTNQNINEKVNQLSGKLDQVHADISATQMEIEQVLANMDAADSQRMKEIMKSFTDINASLAEINTDMDTAHEELKTLIETVRTEAGENQEELLGVLNQIDTSFTEQTSQNYEALVQSLNSQTETMKAQLEAMNSSLMQNTAQIAMEVSGGNAEILQKLIEMENSTNNMLSGLSGDVRSVFQRVSNGKKLLASALLTKNVVIDEDATFQEIYDGILRIEQQIVIGVDKIPGNIEYEYHHHTGSPENGGGCYTVEDVHYHDAGCYQICEYSWTGCAGDGWTDGNSVSHCPYRETHSICNNGQTMYKTYDHPNYGGSQSGHRSGGSSTHVILVCSKTEGQHCGWKTGCGLQEGQITGAHIVYDAGAVSEAAATYEREAVENRISFQKLAELLKSGNASDMELTGESMKMEENETTTAGSQLKPEEGESTAQEQQKAETETAEMMTQENGMETDTMKDTEIKESMTEADTIEESGTESPDAVEEDVMRTEENGTETENTENETGETEVEADKTIETKTEETKRDDTEGIKSEAKEAEEIKPENGKNESEMETAMEVSNPKTENENGPKTETAGNPETETENSVSRKISDE